MGWFDVGVNLTNTRLPFEPVVERAEQARVQYMAITGTSVSESQHAADLAERRPGKLFSTAGIHPHYAKDAESDYVEQLRKLASRPEVVAIGECGLDFNRNFSPPDTQLSVFEAQLALACELKLPLFLHERDAFSEQLDLLSSYQSDWSGGVAHCFTGCRTQMEAYLELGLYIGITGWVCDPKRGEDLREAVRTLPLNRILLETDAPYLYPKGLKSGSSTNEPANLPYIGEFLGQLLDLPVEVIQQHSTQNACRLFGVRQ